MTPAQWERLVAATDRAGWPREEVRLSVWPRDERDECPADWQAATARWRGGVRLSRVVATGATADEAVDAVCVILSGGNER